MLVHSGGKPAIMEDDGKLSRRTVVGQDRKGRIVFVVSSELFFTSRRFRHSWRVRSGIGHGLELDGGTSSGMLIAGREARWAWIRGSRFRR